MRRSTKTTAASISIATFLIAAPAAAQQFPADADWWALECGDVPSFDPVADEAGASNERDIVGDADAPAMWAYADADHFFFRMRVDADPTQGMAFKPFGWGLVLDTDDDLQTYEVLIQVDGNGDQVVLRRNTEQATVDSPNDPAETLVTSWPTETHAQVALAQAGFASNFGGNEDWFVDFAVDRTALENEGIDDATTLVVLMGTSSNAQSLDADLACNRGGSDPRSFSDSASDPVLSDGSDPEPGPDPDPNNPDPDMPPADSDGDGYADYIEVANGTDPNDPNDFPEIGIRGGPGACSAAGSGTAGSALLFLVALFGLRLRRRES